MIDDSDGDAFWLASMFTSGFGGFILLALAIVLWVIAANNKEECSEQKCPAGMTTGLHDHECVCIVKAVKP